MNVLDEFCLQEYQDLGLLEEGKAIRLKRQKRSGIICLEKRVPIEKEPIYQALQREKIEGVPEIFLCVEDEQELILVEKYIEGKSLEDVLQERKLTETEILDILLSLCDILDALHHGITPIICRDLKAENIMMGLDGRIWLVDFDIARFFQQGKRRDTELLGTAEYAAPEQFGFFQTDSRTDIYSIGVLMNYMLTGYFPVEQMAEGKFKTVIENCTYLDPEKRYQDIAELKNVLLRLGGKDTKPQHDGWRGWLPPGFRQGKPMHILFALIGYVAVTQGCFTMSMELEGQAMEGLQLRLEQFFFWLAGMIFVFVMWNYRGIRDEIPLLNHKHKFVRAGGGILFGGVLFFAMIFLCALVETLFF